MTRKSLARRRNYRLRNRLSTAGPSLVPSFADDNQTVQIFARLRDADSDENGLSSLGAIQDSLPPDFDAVNGATGNGTSKAIELDTSSIATALNSGGRISFEIPLSELDSYPTATEYFLSKSGGWSEFRESTHGYLRSRIPESADPIRIYTDTSVRTGVLDEDFVEIAYAWNGSEAWFEVDKLPFKATRSAAGADSTFNDFYALGLTTTAATGDGLTMRNLRIYTGPPNYSANPDYGKIVFFGDSFIRQGALHSTQVAEATIPWDPGYGFNPGAVPSTSGLYTSDCGLIASFMRECFRGGLQPGSSNHNDAEGGDKIGAAKTRAETWFASNTAQVAVVSIGTNNVAESEFDAAEKAANEADYRALIDACTAGGCNRIVINKVASLRNDPTYQTAAHDANLAWWNDILVPSLQDYSNLVVVADTYTATGSNTPDSSLFQSNNLHLNSKGQHVYGRELGLALINSFS